MKKTAHLTPSERDFLELIARAVFANPFSDDRTDIDTRISGIAAGAAPRQRVQAVHQKVHRFLEDLRRKNRGHAAAYADRDRFLLTYAMLFDVFDRFLHDFDTLIQQQIPAGDTSCPVPFARPALDQLSLAGFPANEAIRYFGLFYQLRRAYHFVRHALVGRSPSMKHLRSALWNNVFTYDTHLYDRHLWNRMEDFSTLILGETGAGKGAAAMAIGRSGYIPFEDRHDRFTESFMRSFIDINLSQFPETLIESELFGHRKGAFTGATENHEGVFSRCSPHGAIFLDEIGDVSVPVQIKLLKVIQEREFSPVGSHDKRRFHGRVIAASNKSMDERRRAGLFRDDFFYRLCSDIIVVPPLRQRLQEDPGELDDMLGTMIRRIVGQDSEELFDIVRSVIQSGLGKDYAWPGNVRELEQCVRRILLTHRYSGDHVAVAPDPQSQIIEGIRLGRYAAPELLAAYCSLLYDRFGTYEEVARRTRLDRRTVKKYVSRREVLR